MLRPPPEPTLFPYTTLFRSRSARCFSCACVRRGRAPSTACSRCTWVRLIRTPFGIPFAEPSARGGGNLKLARGRSEEHTSELQSRRDLVCRLLLEKKKMRHG